MKKEEIEEAESHLPFLARISMLVLFSFDALGVISYYSLYETRF
jgi:hypothetical protein